MPPVAEKLLATTVRLVPRFKMPEAIVRVPVFQLLVRRVVPPEPFCLILGWVTPFLPVKVWAEVPVNSKVPVP